MPVEDYFKLFRLTSPNCMAMRRAGCFIRQSAEQYLRGRLLDIGCGAKAKKLLIGDLVEKYIGLDHAESLHDQSQTDLAGTAYGIPETDGAYDSVLCTSVLEHLEEPERALREAFRVLKPGGHALYTVPLFWHLHEAPRDFFRYTSFGLKHLFEKCGFEIVELAPLSGFWLTMGSEWSYYLDSVARGPLSILAKPLIALNNLLFPLLDALDRKLHPAAVQWSWLYLAVVRKPPGGMNRL